MKTAMILFSVFLIIGSILLAGLAINALDFQEKSKTQSIQADSRNCASMFNDVIVLYKIIEKSNFVYSQLNMDLFDTIDRISNIMFENKCWDHPNHWERYLSEPGFVESFDLIILEEKISSGTKHVDLEDTTSEVIIEKAPGLFSLFFTDDSDFELVPKIKSNTINFNHTSKPHNSVLGFSPTPQYCAILFDEEIADLYIQIQTIENPSYEIREQGLHYANKALVVLAQLNCWTTVDEWNEMSKHKNILEKIDIKQIIEDTKGFDYKPAYLADNGVPVRSGGTIGIVSGNINDFDETKKTYGETTTWVKLHSGFIDNRSLDKEIILNIFFKDLRNGDSGSKYLIPDVRFDVKIFKDHTLISKPLSINFTPNGSVSIPFDFQGEGEYTFLVHVTELKNETIPKESVLISGLIRG